MINGERVQGPTKSGCTRAVTIDQETANVLRHVHATTLLPNGVPVRLVAVRLGHADTALTLRVHTKAMDGGAVSKKAPPDDRKGPSTWEPPIGIEPMTYSLRVNRSAD